MEGDDGELVDEDDDEVGNGGGWDPFSLLVVSLVSELSVLSHIISSWSSFDAIFALFCFVLFRFSNCCNYSSK